MHYQTLVKLKRLIELVRYNGGSLAVILAGHPKLKNDLRRPSLEEIGARASLFTLQGIQGSQTEFIHWLLNECSQPKVVPTDLLAKPAIELLSERLTTPLQIEQYLTMAFEEAYRAGQKTVTPDVIRMILAKGLDDLEPRLIRHGYNAKVIANLRKDSGGAVPFRDQ